jgi:acetyltransferase-like isoleucine patch superfamily enzyme
MIKRILNRLFSKKSLVIIGKYEIESNTNFDFHLISWNSIENQVKVGADSLINCKILFEKSDSKLSIGSRTFIGGGTKLVSAKSITIGDDVLISWGVTIVDHNSHAIEFSKRKDDVTKWANGVKDWTNVKIEPVVIGNKCWIGFDVIILKGVQLGEGCIVGAGSVVTKSFPAWSIIGGNPAKLIRTLKEDER